MFVLALLQALVLASGAPPRGLCDGRPVLGSEENGVECETYCRLLAQAVDLGTVKAEPIKRPTYRQLYDEPDRFRCQVVGVQGTLKRVTVYDAPDFVRARTGLKTLYEAWLALPPTGEPLCIVLTHWPLDMPHSGSLDIRVAAAGYFFKRYRYAAPAGWRDAPLLVGGSILPQAAGESASAVGIRAALPCAAAMVALAILRLWLWMEDRSHRRLLDRVNVRG